MTEEFLYNDDVSAAKRAVEAEIVQRENDTCFDMDPILSTYTLRQLREELKRYGKEVSCSESRSDEMRKRDFNTTASSGSTPNRDVSTANFKTVSNAVNIISQSTRCARRRNLSSEWN